MSVRDITEHNLRYRALVAGIPDLMIHVRRDGTLLGEYMSNPAEVEGTMESVPMPFKLKLLELVGVALDSGKVQSWEASAVFGPSGERHFEARISPIGNDECLVIVRNITQRKATEKALIEAKNLFESAFENAPVGMAMASMDAEYFRVNRSFCQLVGYDAEELMGKNYAFLTFPEDLELYSLQLKPMLEGRVESFIGERRYRHRLGHAVWARVSISAVRDQSGARAFFVGQMENINEMKLAQQELIRAREEADRANRAKTDFLSRMSHELRTPLNAILGFSQLLQVDAEQVPDPAFRERVELIVKAGMHLLDLINEVLDLSGVEAGKLTIDRKAVDPKPLIDDSLRLVEPSAGRRNIRILDRTAQMTVPRVVGDALRIRQVLLNLLSNAVKYNWQDGTITLSVEKRAEDRLRFLIIDTGPGIPEAQMSRLFKPFSRLEVNREKAEGTGVGLALSQRLVEAMGGTIGVESVYGKGSTFWFELPVSSE